MLTQEVLVEQGLGHGVAVAGEHLRVEGHHGDFFKHDGIADGIRAFARRIRGFDMYDAVLTAVESRSSSPVRIQRTESGEATRVKGLYPVGEGAGYAGGIVSAAVDGIKAAEKLISAYAPVH